MIYSTVTIKAGSIMQRLHNPFFPQKNTSQEPHIILYLDFDGTLTHTPGNQLVYTPLYQALVFPNKYPHFIATTDRALEHIVHRMERTSREDEDTFAMTEEAIDFFRGILTLKRNGHAIDINIISRNCKTYIQAVLLHGGVLMNELPNINIYDVNNGGGRKDIAVFQIGKTSGATHVLISDDDEGDCNKMTNAVMSLYGNAVVIDSVNKKPGDFDWKQQLNRLQNIFGFNSLTLNL